MQVSLRVLNCKLPRTGGLVSFIRFNNEAVFEVKNITINQLLISKGLNPSTIMIRVDGRIICRDQYNTFIIPNGAEVKAYPFVGGG